MSGAMALARVALAALAATAAVLAAMVIAPPALPPRPRHGARAARRARALRASALWRAAEPVARALSWHARRLPLAAARERLAARLVQAGEPAGLCADEFLGLCALGCAAGAMAGLLVFSGLGLLSVALLAAVGAWYPSVWLEGRARARLSAIHRALPHANDLLVLAMEAGADFPGALRHLCARARGGDPLGEELGRVVHDIDLGATRRDALAAFAGRAPIEPVRGFVAAVVQAEQRGTPVAAALRVQSAALRVHRSLLIEKLANRASVLILLPLLLIFAATVLILFGGLIVRFLRGELM